MKIYITGADTQVGKSFLSNSRFSDFSCNLFDKDSIVNAFREFSPDFVLNLHEKSDVYWCEDPTNKEEVIKHNFSVFSNLIEVAEKFNVPVIGFSSDYIYDGKKKDVPNPKNFYGLSKFTMESYSLAFRDVKVIRTSKVVCEYDEEVQKIISSQDSKTIKKFSPNHYRGFIPVKNFIRIVENYLYRYNSMPDILNIAGDTESWYSFALLHSLYRESNVIPHGIDVVDGKTDYFSVSFIPKKLGLDTTVARELGLYNY